MTLTVKLREHWNGEYRRNQPDYGKLLAAPLINEKWSPCGAHTFPEMDFRVGVSIYIANGSQDEATDFLTRAYQAADILMQQQIPEKCPLGSASPWAGLYRVRGHAGWLLGKSWDAVARDLRLAAEYLEKANTSTKTDLVEWDSISQGQWLGAVRLLMLVRDFDAARTLLKKKRRFGHAPDEYRLLTALLADPAGARTNTALQDDFDRFYDPLRFPYPPPPHKHLHDIKYLRWELGLLRDQLFISSTGVPDLDRVITMIAT